MRPPIRWQAIASGSRSPAGVRRCRARSSTASTTDCRPIDPNDGWDDYVELASGHWPMFTVPQALAEVLAAQAAQLRRQPAGLS
jgi:hypothetical protein